MKTNRLLGAVAATFSLVSTTTLAGENGIACELLNPDLLRQFVELPADAEGRPANYGGHDLCSYNWPVKNATELQAAWQKEMMDSVTKGKGVPPYPKLENSVSLTWIKTDDSEEQAEQRFEQSIAMLEEGITVKKRGNELKATTKSGEALPQANDPEAEAEGKKMIEKAEQQIAALPETGDIEISVQDSFERIEGVGEEAVYGQRMRSLQARSGKQRITVNVRHEDGTEREMELAIDIARNLIQNTPH